MRLLIKIVNFRKGLSTADRLVEPALLRLPPRNSFTIPNFGPPEASSVSRPPKQDTLTNRAFLLCSRLQHKWQFRQFDVAPRCKHLLQPLRALLSRWQHENELSSEGVENSLPWAVLPILEDRAAQESSKQLEHIQSGRIDINHKYWRVCRRLWGVCNALAGNI